MQYATSELSHYVTIPTIVTGEMCTCKRAFIDYRDIAFGTLCFVNIKTTSKP